MVAPWRHRGEKSRPVPPSRAGDCELSFARIHALQFERSASFTDQRSEGPSSTSDVEPLQSGTGRKPFEERFSGKPAPRAHAPLVGVTILEANALHGVVACQRALMPASFTSAASTAI